VKESVLNNVKLAYFSRDLLIPAKLDNCIFPQASFYYYSLSLS